jgi:hypothetical protein
MSAATEARKQERRAADTARRQAQAQAQARKTR